MDTLYYHDGANAATNSVFYSKRVTAGRPIACF